MTPNTPILQEIHAELSLWQKIKLLARIYWRYFVESVPVKFLVFFFGVPLIMIFRRKQVIANAGEIMAEELGKTLPNFSIKKNEITFNSENRWIRQYDMATVTLAINNPDKRYNIQNDWEYDLGEAVGVHNLTGFGYCTQNELNHWFIEDLKSGDPNPKAYARTLENRGKGWTTRTQLTQATYYSGSVPSGSYYVDLRWDTVANGEVNEQAYRDFWTNAK